MSTWFDQSNNANKFRQTYVKGFVDVSGGGVMIRSDNSLNLYTTSDTSVPTFSIQASSYSVKHDGNTTTVLTEKLRHLVSLDENTQDRLDDHTRRTQHMDACANVTYFVEDVSMSGDIKVAGSATLESTLDVTGATTLTGALDANSTADIADTLTLSKASGLGLNVTSDASFGGDVAVVGATTLTGALDANSTADIADTLTLSKASGLGLNVTSDASFGGTVAVVGATTLTGALDANSTADIADTLTLSKASGTGLSVTADASVGGTLGVTGATTLSSSATIGETLDVTGLTTMTSAVATTDISAAALHVDDIHINSNDIYSTAGTDIIIRPGNNQSYSDDVDRKVRVVGDLHVDGSINFTGDFIKTDTIVRVTEQMDVSNNGTGPAFIARQHGSGAGYDIAEFYDDASLAVAIKDGGHVDMHNDVHVGGNMDISGTFLVTSTSTFNNDITIQNNADIDMTAGGFIHQV